MRSAARAASKAIKTCPKDGHPMRTGHDGIKFCEVCVAKLQAVARKERARRRPRRPQPRRSP